jgi:hypothetical protein
MSELITIMRKWNNPEINLWMNNDEIGMSVDLADFVEAFIQELETRISLDDFIRGIIEGVGSVAWTFTRSGIEGKIKAAAGDPSQILIEKVKTDIRESILEVVSSIKKETIKIVGGCT